MSKSKDASADGDGQAQAYSTFAAVTFNGDTVTSCCMLPTRPASFTEEVYDGEDESIRRVFKAEGGCVIEVSAAGYAGELLLWVGVTDDGTVSGVTIRDHAETFGLGGRAQSDASFLLQFLGTKGDAAVGENVNALTGATVTSKAVTRAVNAAVGWVTGADVSSGATEWGG